MDINSQPIILAFSGGLDTTAIALWLQENYSCEIIAYCAALGNADSPDEIGRHAKRLGIETFIYEDLEEELLADFINPFLKTGASYQSNYLLGTAIARPLIASKIAAVAKKYNAKAIVHGATGKGNDQIRFEKAWSYLVPGVELIAPWKLWDFKGREDLIQYISDKGYDFDFPNKTFSIDENLFHVSYEGGPLESLETSYEDHLPHLAPVKTDPEQWKLSFEAGQMTAVESIGDEGASYQNSLDAFKKLNEIGSGFAIGIEDIVEERINGIKSRGIYATPAGTMVKHALDQLKSVCWDYETFQTAQFLAIKYGESVYHGNWFGPAKNSIDAFFSEACQSLNGEITLKISPNTIKVACRKVSLSLYSEDLVSFENDKFGLNAAADGFCKTLNFKYQNMGEIHV
ncbi:argininosuccinate synthase [Oligoflexaceae bacterium]|nr:argininosuccinate synthase [Oligoflexaceae bacterium]